MLDNINDLEAIKKSILENDKTIRLWDFTRQGLERKKRDFDFISGNFGLSVIDPFNGVLNPHLISYETLTRSPLPRLVQTVILDSNVMSVLHRFVSKPKSLNEDQRKVVINLLDYLVIERVDYNPSFYYLESLTKLKESADERYIRGCVQSILTLHTMDELHFLKHREIRVDHEHLEIYSDRYGSKKLDEMAFNVLEGVKNMKPLSNDWNLFYLILLKAALIHKTERGDLRSKMNKLNDFIYSVFGVLFSRELSIAAFYFSGKLDSFIPFQKGANFDDVVAKFRSSAWDIFLLRFPEMLLSSSLEPIPLAVVCTGDKAAGYIGRKFKIRRLYCNNKDFIPELEFDYSDIVDASFEKGEIIRNLFSEYSRNRNNRRMLYDVDQVFQQLSNIVRKLENEIKALCA